MYKAILVGILLCMPNAWAAPSQAEQNAAVIASIKAAAKRHGFSDVYLDGVSFFIQTAMYSDISHQKPVVRFNPKLDNAFVMSQSVDRYIIYRHQYLNIPIPPVQKLNSQLAGIILAVPRETGRQYFNGEALGRAVGDRDYLAYLGTIEFETVLGVHVTAMAFKPQALR